jgi:hypothetical protein
VCIHVCPDVMYEWINNVGIRLAPRMKSVSTQKLVLSHMSRDMHMHIHTHHVTHTHMHIRIHRTYKYIHVHTCTCTYTCTNAHIDPRYTALMHVQIGNYAWAKFRLEARRNSGSDQNDVDEDSETCRRTLLLKERTSRAIAKEFAR